MSQIHLDSSLLFLFRPKKKKLVLKKKRSILKNYLTTIKGFVSLLKFVTIYPFSLARFNKILNIKLNKKYISFMDFKNLINLFSNINKKKILKKTKFKRSLKAIKD